MKFTILCALTSMTVAVPQYSHDAPATSYSSSPDESADAVAILKDERLRENDGNYNFDFESENGIRFTESGSPDGEENAIISAGEYSYTAPDGTEVIVKYVANEKGFQPESNLLPEAPEFPFEIPQYVLDQIAFAAEEDFRRALGGSSEEPSGSYGAPP